MNNNFKFAMCAYKLGYMYKKSLKTLVKRIWKRGLVKEDTK